MPDVLRKIEKIEAEMARIPKNKVTSVHLDTGYTQGQAGQAEAGGHQVQVPAGGRPALALAARRGGILWSEWPSDLPVMQDSLRQVTQGVSLSEQNTELIYSADWSLFSERVVL